MINNNDPRENMIVDLDKSNLFVPFHISLMENQNYSATEKMVYLALKSFCINARMCYPSQALIMKRASIKSNKTLTTTLQSLESKRVLLNIPEFDENNRRKSNTYYLAKFNFDNGDFDTSSLDAFKVKKDVATAHAEQLKQTSKK